MLKTLNGNYGINGISIEQVEGGWSALAYKVIADEGVYFLKAYEKSRASTLRLISRTPIYGAITYWLEKNTDLEGQILVPIQTIKGAFYCENQQFYFVLHPYIQGRNMWEIEMTKNQVQQLAHIVATLHKFGEEIPCPTTAIKEDFEIPWLENLEKVIENVSELEQDLREVLGQGSKCISEHITVLKRIKQEIQAMDVPLRLCHTDIHGMNIMSDQNGKLILIDFETLMLAPAEMDLRDFCESNFWNDFYEVYQREHPEFQLNPTIIRYYQLRRIVEDCWEWIEQLLYDEQSYGLRKETISALQNEIKSRIIFNKK